MAGEQRTIEMVEASPDDVAALLTARTKDPDGNLLGTWTQDTRPTWDEVQTRIDIARSIIAATHGPIPDRCREIRETNVALLAAAICEEAFWPEQVEPGQSTYEPLRDLYQEAREGLVRCIEATTGEPLYAFELDVGYDPCRAWPADWWQRNLETAGR